MIQNSYLPSNCTTLAITITPHPLRYFESFLWIYKGSAVKWLLVVRVGAIHSWSDRSTVVLLAADISL